MPAPIISDPFRNAVAHSGYPVYIHTDPYSGRSYRVARALSAGTVLFDVPTPYSYNIYKRFRNEVCAECWRYEGGRRGFLSRKDDHGYECGGVVQSAPSGGSEVEAGAAAASVSENGSLGRSASGSRSVQQSEKRKSQGTGAGTGTGTGLWFCDAICQASWIDREGREALWILRAIEGARRSKEVSDGGTTAAATALETGEITQDTIDRAWEEVSEKEAKGGWKEMKTWKGIQLDDYETDMARYVALALLRLHRERRQQQQQHPADSDASDASEQTNANPGAQSPDLRRGEDWEAFAALQNNELQQLRPLPTLITHQIRIYQALKGHLSPGFLPHPRRGRAQKPKLPQEHIQRQNQQPQQQQQQQCVGPKQECGDGHIGQVGEGVDLRGEVTVGNVRTALGVDPGNSFGIWEIPVGEESECLGFGVYPQLSLFNHSCAPNVRKEHAGRGLRFVTTRAVGADEELCISYGHVEVMDWKKRQQELLEGWFFECRCARCVAEMKEAES